MKLFQASERQIWLHSILNDFLRKHPFPHESLPREIREVLACIHQNLFDLQLNVRYLKSCCRIRDNNISSRFRCTMGVTIKQYIETLRILAAAHLLREADICVLDVAMAVGYSNLQTFYHAFERCYGCTPGDYRRRLDSLPSPAVPERDPYPEISGAVRSQDGTGR